MSKGLFTRGALQSSRLSAYATPVGQMAMLESSQAKHSGELPSPPSDENPSLSEEMLLEAVYKKAGQDARGIAAAAVIDWAQNGEGTFDAFDEFALGLADIPPDSDDDFTDEQIDDYNLWLGLMADAAVAMGASQRDVTAMIDNADDDAADAVLSAIDVSPNDEDDAIAEFAVTGDDDGAMMEASIKVVRNGVVKLIRKQPRPRRLSAAQKSALKKARMKAQTASAKTARKKSNLVRKKHGL
ncbi:hypothetical protein ID852_03270 [Xenorhabdus sp. 42]|uniref:hypothetical protein n=1 Tax=Xenorhabdus szentirmaii TaxID=290112 RepID=UPI0019A29CA2|nr:MULTISPECIES: hypothetical protein [unclassified Xenorhabdus]MBD2782219.1 hypothetical protein [Xenorhabdus sp. 38]MBD2819728.1 hypothetical protein [Xenorhabdus sp. 42]